MSETESFCPQPRENKCVRILTLREKVHLQTERKNERERDRERERERERTRERERKRKNDRE